MRSITKISVLFLAGFFYGSLLLQAQSPSDSVPQLKTYRVGIFAPLYLDSVFGPSGKFRYKQAMPRFMMPGTDFVNGAIIALDSLDIEGMRIEATVYDTKSFTAPLTQLIQDKKIERLDLLIGAVKDNDFKALADLALNRKIPFISASYPNDGGITRNPYVVILNSTIRAHCESIFSYVLSNHGTDRIFLCRKPGAQEDKIAACFKSINEQDGSALLNIKTISIDSNFSSEHLAGFLDSNRNAVIIGGSLDEKFASGLSSVCYVLSERYAMKLIGMPNWDGFRSLQRKADLEDFPIYFTTPYYNPKTDYQSRILTSNYARKMKGKPTDMAFKGYECIRYFVGIFSQYPSDFMKHLSDNTFSVFTDFNIRPVYLRQGNTLPDYYENKHLYMMKILNGAISRAW
jgi:ABC-type branched-subunit amino acid transport system substrate-binding protein